MADYVDREDVRLTFRAVAPIIPWNTLDYILSLIPSAKQWIPCSEQKPEKEKEVLICTEHGMITDGIFHGDGEIIEWDGATGDRCFDSDEVIAWMPLPEPYKGGEEE